MTTSNNFTVTLWSTWPGKTRWHSTRNDMAVPVVHTDRARRWHESVLLTFTCWMSWRVDQRLPLHGDVTEYSCIREQTSFQITPLPGQPKKRAEMIVMVEYSKIFCSLVFFCHQPKQGVSAILHAAGENSILDLCFFSLPTEDYSVECFQTSLKTCIPPPLHPFLYSTWMALDISLELS